MSDETTIDEPGEDIMVPVKTVSRAIGALLLALHDDTAITYPKTYKLCKDVANELLAILETNPRR